jgi:serine O-acetyltransferase
LNFKEFKSLVLLDLYRYQGKVTGALFFKSYFLIPGFNYLCWFRMGQYKNSFLLKYILFRKSVSYGIQIPSRTRIGKGFYVGHFGGIVISGGATIGNNCNISQNVTIGLSPRGKKKGYPTIGDNCYIGPGAKIIGNIKIGDNVAIGANAVVTKSIPDNAVVVGVPAKIISYNGSSGYIVNRV